MYYEYKQRDICEIQIVVEWYCKRRPGSALTQDGDEFKSVFPRLLREFLGQQMEQSHGQGFASPAFHLFHENRDQYLTATAVESVRADNVLLSIAELEARNVTMSVRPSVSLNGFSSKSISIPNA